MGNRDADKNRAYMRTYMLARYNKRMELAREKLGARCAQCGLLENLQLDHIDPVTKSFTIGKLSSCSEKKFWAEVAKCQLLCQSCHITKTKHDLGKQDARAMHGTISSYRYCHCSVCRAAVAAYQRQRRASNSTGRESAF